MDMVNLQSSDPAKALIGLSNVKEATDEILISFDKIRKTIILNKDKLNYVKTDPGYSLMFDSQSDASIKLQ